jgi:hypothetical protein
MPRTCVFCGGSPVTKEHVWPDWARRKLASPESFPHYRRLERQGQHPVDKHWLAPAHTMTVSAVCGPCNNGWMSELEARAKELLEPMLDGYGKDLHRDGQRTLAAWALKTMLMAEQAHDAGRRAIPPEEYEHLFRTGEPSDNCVIWIAAYGGDMLAASNIWGGDADLTLPDDRGQRQIWGATISLGPVAFQLFGTTVPGLLEGAELGSPPYVHQLWPYRESFTWLPGAALDEQALADFASSIVNMLPK